MPALRPLLPIALVALAALAAWRVGAEETRVTFPPLDELVHYTTVTRGEVTEHMLASRETIAAVQAGQPIPDGEHVVLVDYRGGAVHRYFVMQKGAGWGADYDDRRRTGDWQFQWFWADRSINLDENTARCQSCHNSRADREYMFTFNDLRRFEQ